MARKKNRWKDRKSAPGPSLIKPHGNPAIRHEQRKQFNLQNRHRVEEWCRSRGVKLRINANGEHWIFDRDKANAQWWPSTAKLVVDRNYRNGIHTHDYQQLMAVLDKSFPEIKRVEAADPEFPSSWLQTCDWLL